jgi:hypothetical protein
LEAVLLSAPELAAAIGALGPVRPSVASVDLRATRAHAFCGERERRKRQTAHERIAEAIERRRLLQGNAAGSDTGVDHALDTIDNT